MQAILTITLFFISFFATSQTTLSGKIVDEKGSRIAGANIFIEGTYDGTSSNESGDFTFATTSKGNQTLVVSFLAYETLQMPISIDNFQYQIIKLRQSVNTLDGVVVTARKLESGNKTRASVLKPLDIVTTAGSAGNSIAALQTLPGTQKVGEDGRLFVRGGEADETQTFVDGIRVAQPYTASAQNLPTRGRFSPFLFSGTSFSTGGYSAEYGEALSSVLFFNTEDEPVQNKTDMMFLSVGLGLGNTQKWKKSSLSLNTSYINLAPYQAIVKQKVDWNRPYQSLSGETVYRYNFNSGIFKLYAAYDDSQFDINQENVNFNDKVRVDLKNNNFYFNSSYKGNFGENWQIVTGLSYGHSLNKTEINRNNEINHNNLNNEENSAHFKLKLKKSLSKSIKLSFGGDYFITDFKEDFTPDLSPTLSYGYNNAIAAVFTEADILFSNKLAVNIGLRAANNSLLDENRLSPRVSLVYKAARNSQFSLAYGDFSQTPKVDYIKYSKWNQFESEKASHYILNFEYNKNGQTFRAETYFKDYTNLVKYDTEIVRFNSNFNNKGNGYAKGLDLFWRDKKSIKNLEYWVSYSYIDTKRDYKNFPIAVTPSFVADHSLSLVTKYFSNELKSLISLTNSFSTGRLYNNPNEAKFMNGKTKSYNDLSFSWAYLLTTQKIFYVSVSNVLGSQNVFGYDYALTPDVNGVYKRQAITPPADRFFLVGFLWTISNNKKDNQLKNL